MAAAVAAVILLVFLDRDDRFDPALAQVSAVGGGGKPALRANISWRARSPG